MDAGRSESAPDPPVDTFVPFWGSDGQIASAFGHLEVVVGSELVLLTARNLFVYPYRASVGIGDHTAALDVVAAVHTHWLVHDSAPSDFDTLVGSHRRIVETGPSCLASYPAQSHCVEYTADHILHSVPVANSRHTALVLDTYNHSAQGQVAALGHNMHV